MTHVNFFTQLARADEVRRLHYASENVLIKALKFGMLIGTRLTTQDVYLYRLVFNACPCCLAGKTISHSLSPTAMMPGSIVHVDLIPFHEICLGEIQYHMLIVMSFQHTYIYLLWKRKVIQT